MSLRRSIASLIISLVFLFSSCGQASAGIVLVDKRGAIIWKVLGLTMPQRDSLEITDVVGGESPDGGRISLLSEDGKVQMRVATAEGEKNVDVSGYSEDLIEIEERPELQRVKIGTKNGNFSIEQKGIVAETAFPIEIDAKRAELLVATPSGKRVLAILPYGAFETLLKPKIISGMENGKMNLMEGEKGELLYAVTGERSLNILNIMEYSVPVSASVSALTGEIVSVEQPTWLRILGFVFAS